MDDRLAAFKRELLDAQGDSSATTSKKLKLMEQPVLKSDGNKQQFQHELKVLEQLEDA